MKDVAAHATARGVAMGLIQECTRCSLRARARAPVPFRGPSPNALMVLGEAPGATEEKYGKPFLGAAGKHLSTSMHYARLPELKTWFVANVCSCRAYGPPTSEQTTACQPNLRAQVQLCNPEWVLVLGATALTSVIPRGAKIGKLHGRPFYVPAGPFIGRWVFPTFHPAAALRDAHHDAALSNDLSTMARILRGEIDRNVLAARVGRGGKVFV